MTPLDLRIDRLRLVVRNAAGHEHRLASITERAAALLAHGVDARRAGDVRAVSAAAAPSVHIDLARMTDAAVAQRIVATWLAALAPRADARLAAATPGTRAGLAATTPRSRDGRAARTPDSARRPAALTARSGAGRTAAGERRSATW
jgi:hypothetical protein